MLARIDGKRSPLRSWPGAHPRHLTTVLGCNPWRAARVRVPLFAACEPGSNRWRRACGPCRHRERAGHAARPRRRRRHEQLPAQRCRAAFARLPLTYGSQMAFVMRG